MKDEALKLIEKGFRVVPCNGKKPSISNWTKYPIYSKENLYKRWLPQYDNNNIMIATGNGIIVIDCDIKPSKNINGVKALTDFMKKLNIELPHTLSVTTGGGGKHYYFKTDSKTIKNRVNFLELGGVDIRATGGGVVAPPSLHESGNYYTWDNDCEIATLPKELEDILVNYDEYKKEYTKKDKQATNSKIKKRKKQENSSFKEEYKKLEPITEGTRNFELFRLASLLAGIGISLEAIEEVLYIENQNRCTPPLDEEEIQGIISNSISKYSPGDYTTGGFDKLYTGELSCNEIAIYTFLWWETLTLKDKTLYRNQQYIADRIGGVGTQIVGKTTKSLHDKGFIDMKLVPNRNGGHPCYCYKVL